MRVMEVEARACAQKLHSDKVHCVAVVNFLWKANDAMAVAQEYADIIHLPLNTIRSIMFRIGMVSEFEASFVL